MKTNTGFLKIIYMAAGHFAVGLGVLGIFLPVLPTTPFLLLAAWLYIRGSEKFYNWLINNKILGAYIRDYTEGRGVPRRAKITAVSTMWTFILISAFLFVPFIWARILLIAAALGVTIHIITLPTRKKEYE